MATGKSYYPRRSYRFLSIDQPCQAADSGSELDESDLYSSAGATRSHSPEFRRKFSASCGIRKKPSGRAVGGGVAASLPVNVPDWSKILQEEHRDNRRSADEHDDIDGGEWSDAGGALVPPHEFLARTRMASFSVHEGVGRTLKGRDLSRVRNAIFEKTGFQD